MARTARMAMPISEDVIYDLFIYKQNEFSERKIYKAGFG